MHLCMYIHVCMYVCTVSMTGLFDQHPYSVMAITSSQLVKLTRVCDCQSMSLVCFSSVRVNESWEHMSDGGK